MSGKTFITLVVFLLVLFILFQLFQGVLEIRKYVGEKIQNTKLEGKAITLITLTDEELEKLDLPLKKILIKINIIKNLVSVYVFSIIILGYISFPLFSYLKKNIKRDRKEESLPRI